MFHKEGFKIIFYAAAILVLSIFLIDNYVLNYWLQKGLMILVLILFILILQFFRNPKRNTIINDNHIIAPADGKIVVIEE